MKLISLLPEEVRYKQKKKKKRVAYMVICTMTFLFALAVYFIISMAVVGVHKDYNRLKERNTAYQNELDELKKYDDYKQKVSDMEKKIEQAYGKSVDWVTTFDGIGQSIPGDVWLDSLDVSVQDNNYTLEMAGGAKNMYYVNDWVEKLKQVPGLQDINLGQTSIAGSNINTYIKFDISAKLEAVKTYTFQPEVATDEK